MCVCVGGGGGGGSGRGSGGGGVEIQGTITRTHVTVSYLSVQFGDSPKKSRDGSDRQRNTGMHQCQDSL